MSENPYRHTFSNLASYSDFLRIISLFFHFPISPIVNMLPSKSCNFGTTHRRSKRFQIWSPGGSLNISCKFHVNRRNFVTKTPPPPAARKSNVSRSLRSLERLGRSSPNFQEMLLTCIQTHSQTFMTIG